MDDNKCATCSGETKGYKCEECGTEAEQHDAAHACGGDKCKPMCAGCNMTDSKCTCPTV
ncbi:MAG: hypothetical protein Q7T49_00685 [bacterium]|nr:hypothetical protein [bacterium]